MRFANKHFSLPAALLLLVGCSKSEDPSVEPPPPPPPAVDAKVDLTAPPGGDTAPPPAPAPDALASAPPPTGSNPEPAPATTEFKDIDGKTISLIEYMESLASGYERIRASQTDGTPWPPLTSLDQLVTYRMVSRLPSAPAGKKFVYDSQTGRVSLAAQ